jgi:hypothetical protein
MAVAANQQDIDNFLYDLYRDVPVGSISINSRKSLGVYSENSFIYGDSYLPFLI